MENRTTTLEDRRPARRRRSIPALALVLALAGTLLAGCAARQDLKDGVVEVDGRRYAADWRFQLAPDVFDDQGRPRADRSTRLGAIDGSPVYAIQGLDPAEWIWFDYADCDVGFYLCRNVDVPLEARYFDFSERIVVVRTEYSVQDGLRETLRATVDRGDLVAYAYGLAAADGNADMGVTSDAITGAYQLILTPKAFPALQFVVGYSECATGYFVDSTTNGRVTKVDGRIHDMIQGLEG